MCGDPAVSVSIRGAAATPEKNVERSATVAIEELARVELGVVWTLALASSAGESSLAATAGLGEDPVSMGGAAQFRSELGALYHAHRA